MKQIWTSCWLVLLSVLSPSLPLASERGGVERGGVEGRSVDLATGDLVRAVSCGNAAGQRGGRRLEVERVEFGPRLPRDPDRANRHGIDARQWLLRTPAHFVATDPRASRTRRTLARPCVWVRFVRTGWLLSPSRVRAEVVVRHVFEIVAVNS